MADGEGSVGGGVSVASKVSFAELCGLLEKISRTQGNDKKKRILKEFVDQWREFHKTIHNDDDKLVIGVKLYGVINSNILYVFDFVSDFSVALYLELIVPYKSLYNNK